MSQALYERGKCTLKKKILTAVTAALLVVSMTVTAFAAGSNSGSQAASNASSNPAPAPAAPAPTYTTPNGQPITDALVVALAAVTQDDANVAPVSKATVIAISNYLKLISPNAALVAAFNDFGPAGETSIKSGIITAGTDYSIIIQFTDGRVVIVKPKKVVNGRIVYDKPAGAIASISVAANAKAPR